MTPSRRVREESRSSMARVIRSRSRRSSEQTGTGCSPSSRTHGRTRAVVAVVSPAVSSVRTRRTVSTSLSAPGPPARWADWPCNWRGWRG